MAKGSVAKEAVEKKIQAAFGEDYIGVYDKKLYVWAVENGERVQIAITLTCPKVQIEAHTTTSLGDFNFEDDSNIVIAATDYQPAEITDDERARVNDLMKMLDL